jgi:hypothetical protein
MADPMGVEQLHFSSQKARASVMLEIDRVEPSGLRWISQSVQRLLLSIWAAGATNWQHQR